MNELKENLKEEMRKVFDEFYKDEKPSQTLYDYARRLVKIEREYERNGMRLDEILGIIKEVANELK